ncbi:hypothetical protein T492DRAFT_364650 [Pavlovales sp. CCMP2436]|nr:hypothetical protein T492DRAFT_364650 [Pavlovales sp. CCMP2436]
MKKENWLIMMLKIIIVTPFGAFCDVGGCVCMSESRTITIIIIIIIIRIDSHALRRLLRRGCRHGRSVARDPAARARGRAARGRTHARARARGGLGSQGTCRVQLPGTCRVQLLQGMRGSDLARAALRNLSRQTPIGLSALAVSDPVLSDKCDPDLSDKCDLVLSDSLSDKSVPDLSDSLVLRCPSPWEGLSEVGSVRLTWSDLMANGIVCSARVP